MFSVIIPLFNKASSIADTLHSVLEQSVDCFEVIVVDDGSTDGSADVVKSVSDSRLRLITKQNGGVCSARNMGIRSAKYSLVAFLDADDIWDCDYLKEQQRMAADFPEAYLWGINYSEIVAGHPVSNLATGLDPCFRGIVEDYFLLPEKTGRISDLFCSSSVVVRKEAFDGVGYFDERLKYSEDIDMWFRIIANYPVAFYDKVLAYYRFDAENRAMLRKRIFKYWLPYYPDKYASYKGNEPFYSFIQRWCAVNIKECYFNDREQRTDARMAASRLDYTVLPFKYKYFFNTPFCIAKALYLLGEFKNKI